MRLFSGVLMLIGNAITIGAYLSDRENALNKTLMFLNFGLAALWVLLDFL